MSAYQHLYSAVHHGSSTGGGGSGGDDPSYTFNLSWRQLCFFWTMAVLQGFWWGGLLIASGAAGSYRGLYCFASEWGHFESGGILIILVALTSVCMCFYFYRCWRLLRECDTPAALMAGKMAARAVLLIVLYLGCWLPMIFVVFLNIAQVNSPVELEILAGWMVKIQPTLSCAILYYTPAVRKQREQRRVRGGGGTTEIHTYARESTVTRPASHTPQAQSASSPTNATAAAAAAGAVTVAVNIKPVPIRAFVTQNSSAAK